MFSCLWSNIKISIMKKIFYKKLQLIAQTHLNWVILFLQQISHFSLKYSKLTVSLFLAVFIILGSLSPKTKPALRSVDMNDPEMPSFKDLQFLNNQFGEQEKIIFLIKNGGKPFAMKDYCTLLKWRNKILRENNDILKIESVLDLRSISYNQKDQTLFYPLTIQDPCLRLNDSKYEIHIFEKLNDHPLHHYYMSEQFNEMMLFIQVRANSDPSERFKYDYEGIKNFIKDTKKELPFNILTSGSLFFQSSVLDGLQWAEALNLLVAVMIFLVYFYFYPSKSLSLILILSILFTTATLKGAMYLFDHRIDTLTSFLFFMMTVAVIEDFVFLSFLMKEEALSYSKAVEKILLPSFFTSLTTAIGFGSLALSSSMSIYRFGAWTAIGTMLEWGLLFLFFPALLKVWPKLEKYFCFKSKKMEANYFLLKKMTGFSLSKKWTILATIIPAALMIIYHQPNFQLHILNVFKDDHEIRQFSNEYKKSWNQSVQFSLVFFHSQLDNTDRQIIEKIKKDEMVSAFFSSANYEEYIQKFPKSIHSLLMHEFRQSPTGESFETSHYWRAIIGGKSIESEDVDSFEKRVNKICGTRCRLMEETIVAKDYTATVLNTLYDSFAACIIIVFFILLWLCLAVNPAVTFPVLISTFWAPLSLFSMLFVGNFAVDMVASVALSVLVGVTGDNAIQFLLLNQKHFSDSVKQYAVASLQTIFLMVGISLLMVFSYFKPAVNIAWLMAIGVIFIFIGDVIILNGFLRLFSNFSFSKFNNKN